MLIFSEDCPREQQRLTPGEGVAESSSQPLRLSPLRCQKNERNKGRKCSEMSVEKAEEGEKEARFVGSLLPTQHPLTPGD
ncbi:hypothetical protein RRG08_002438 [Elysia crispata]|uniref:Uncharacterized protein n=1 Tax=Elysia crispata TaxID=231223 RepID=A0AAE1A9V6_9GAST|nr:hypothetical protein RRG08_002438 [Elysia crispata]